MKEDSNTIPDDTISSIISTMSTPVAHFRWLEKEDGTKVLQQAFQIEEIYATKDNKYYIDWIDVPTVSIP